MEDNKAAVANGVADEEKKHKLQHKWTLWYDSGSGGKNWGQNLAPVASFDTVEDFWALMNNLQEPSQLQDKASYNVFKAGIEPKWEDKANQHGGQWRLQLSNRKELMDEFWLKTVMIAIGEGFDAEASEDIAGIVVNIRGRGDRLNIWTKTAADEKLQRSIGEHWRKTAIGQKRIEFIPFEDQMDTGGSGRGGKNRGGYRSRPSPRIQLG